MSALGPAGIPSISIAQSLAGSQRSDGPTSKGDAAVAAGEWQQRSSATGGSTDVADVDMSPERDADGRTPWSDAESRSDGGGQPEQESAPQATVPPRQLPTDPNGRLGKELDFSV